MANVFFDPVGAESDVPARFRFSADNRWWTVALGVGLAALVVAVAVGVGVGTQRLLFAYLIAWTFCVSVALGSLLWVMIQHITKARWGTALRRIPETIAMNLPLLALAGLPVLLGTYDLFHWSHADLYQPGDHYDAILAGKAGYFFWPLAAGTVPVFFYLRYVVYFAIWSTLAVRLYRLSVTSDTRPNAEITLQQRKVSAIGIPLTGVTFAFAGFDWLMSTDPHWFSTMFGVYFFAGGWLGAISLITFLALLLKKAGMLDDVVSGHHIHDMGRYMFAFTVFWTYIAFSQYMLYWYANLAEETIWFAKRLTAGWDTVAWALVIFHFILPFLILILRATKRTYPALATMAVWLLVMHWVDLWWVTSPAMMPAEDHTEEAHAAALPADDAMPLVLTAAQTAAPAETQTVDPATGGGTATAPGATPGTVRETPSRAATGDEAHPTETFNPTVVPAPFPAVEFLMWLGMFGLFLGVTLLRFGRHALAPYGDPYFTDSLRFETT